MTIGAIGGSYSTFTSGITPAQDAAAAQADEVTGLLTDTFGPTSGDGGIVSLLGGETTSESSADAGLTSLLLAYTTTASLTPVALAYLQGVQTNSTMTTFL